MRRLRIATLAILGAMAPAHAQNSDAQDSDAERLNEGLPAAFKRPVVHVYPLLDLRALQRGLNTRDDRPELEVPAAWTEAIKTLKDFGNLDLVGPKATIDQLTGTSTYQRGLEQARFTANQGYAAYREVQLKVAADRLRAAVAAFLAVGHQLVAPREVARAELTRGRALLEAGQGSAAAVAFQTSLRLDPTLRLRPGIDHPAAVEAVDTARQMLAEAIPPQESNPSSPVLQGWVLRGRIVNEHLEVALHGGGSVRFDKQHLGPPDAGQRLASRLHADLPFGRMKRRAGHRQRVFLDAGLDAFTYLKAPLDPVAHIGAGVHVTWLVARALSLDGHLAISNSGRDYSEDLRADLGIVRGQLGPTYIWRTGRLRLGVGAGLEVAYLGEVVLSSNPACKYFSPDDAVPSTLCDHEVDVDRAPPTWVVGPTINLSASLRVVDRFFLTVQTSASRYVYEEEDNGLDLPVGVHLGLGYRLL